MSDYAAMDCPLRLRRNGRAVRNALKHYTDWMAVCRLADDLNGRAGDCPGTFRALAGAAGDGYVRIEVDGSSVVARLCCLRDEPMTLMVSRDWPFDGLADLLRVLGVRSEFERRFAALV